MPFASSASDPPDLDPRAGQRFRNLEQHVSQSRRAQRQAYPPRDRCQYCRQNENRVPQNVRHQTLFIHSTHAAALATNHRIVPMPEGVRPRDDPLSPAPRGFQKGLSACPRGARRQASRLAMVPRLVLIDYQRRAGPYTMNSTMQSTAADTDSTAPPGISTRSYSLMAAGVRPR